MSGIYIHIPFCKQACHYCNFHFSTSLRYKDDVIAALQQEIATRKNYLPTNIIDTVYFGGGTPSLLSTDDLSRIFTTLYQHYTIANNAEITLEANPDDLNKSKLAELATSPVNRLSIGIQSFNDDDLTFMNRAHTAKEAHSCIKDAQDIGITNISIDLIYGTPTMSNADWQANLNRVFTLNVPHISAYCLTVEPKTALHHFIQSGKMAAPNDEQAAKQFEVLINALKEKGYLHYEISNFCLPNQASKHNSSYWQGKPYLGLGPSAHSFNGTSRQWNVANNAQYIKAITKGEPAFEIEILSLNNRYNEYLMTSLRTSQGCSIAHVKTQFGQKHLDHLNAQMAVHLQHGLVSLHKDYYVLSAKAKFIADGIISDLFYVEEV
jgi:oxygen-independent coproporphyrinogen-3 oxidase